MDRKVFFNASHCHLFHLSRLYWQLACRCSPCKSHHHLLCRPKRRRLISRDQFLRPKRHRQELFERHHSRFPVDIVHQNRTIELLHFSKGQCRSFCCFPTRTGPIQEGKADLGRSLSYLAEFPDKLPTHPTRAGGGTDIGGDSDRPEIAFLRSMLDFSPTRSAFESRPRGDTLVVCRNKMDEVSKSTTPHTCVTAVPIVTRSAHVPTGYAAFSTLAPRTTSPLVRRMAQPTLKCEYGP